MSRGKEEGSEKFWRHEIMLHSIAFWTWKILDCKSCSNIAKIFIIIENMIKSLKKSGKLLKILLERSKTL